MSAEIDRAVVVCARVLSLAVPRELHSEFYRMTVLLPRDVVRRVYIRRGRRKVVRRWTIYAGRPGRWEIRDAREGDRRKPIGELRGVSKQRNKLETINRLHPGIALDRSPLLVPVGVESECVDQGRTDHIGPPNLIVISGAIAQVRIHRNGPGSAECGIRIIDANIVVDIPEIETLLC